VTVALSSTEAEYVQLLVKPSGSEDFYKTSE
jgi:hypothetical protein